ncbi:hypothetical protein [Saccharomonospora saliphila]|uniref:hypothetical protein n=1 Tax=Saccharomonospora saliphila TaxID=369829 RepID=UPI00039ADA73|nr:hypothetical protein [Saccharomonospora saliphila]
MTPERFESVEDYNTAYPDCRFPDEPHARSGLRGYRAAMRGVTDDLTDSGMDSLTIDFLPGGAPLPHEADKVGTVVASRWGEGPVLVLASEVSLRAAWRSIRDGWPTELSHVRAALDGDARSASLPTRDG